MPQLDQFTYLSQFVWLCIFFMSFYVLLYNDGLPKISRILKLRTKLVSQQTAGSDQNNLSVEKDGVLKECLNTSVYYLSSSVSGASEWCNGMVMSLNSNQLEPVNKSYVSFLGEMSASQMIKHSVLDRCGPLTSITSRPPFKLSQIFVLRAQKSILGNVKNGPRKKQK